MRNALCSANQVNWDNILLMVTDFPIAEDMIRSHGMFCQEHNTAEADMEYF